MLDCAYVQVDAAIWLTCQYYSGFTVDEIVRAATQGMRAALAEIDEHQSGNDD